MNIEFKPCLSVTRDANMCEIWIDGRMIACIYPSDRNGIRIMSRHVERAAIVDTEIILIEFKPQ